MRIKNYLKFGIGFLFVLGLGSCIDKDYDLSDIDGTARFTLKELTVPMNMDYITLSRVLDLPEDSKVIEEKDASGNTFYAIKIEGTFKSDPVEISNFKAAKPNIEGKTTELDLVDLRTAVGYIGEVTAYYDISSEPTTFKSQTNHFDKSLKYIEKLGVNAIFSNTLKISGFNANTLKNVKIEGLKLKYPKGLTVETEKGTYDAKTGVFDLSNEVIVPDGNGNIEISIKVTEIDATQDNVKIDYENRSLIYEDNFNVIEGRVNIYADENLPDKVTFITKPEISEIEMVEFTGNLEYNSDEFDIEPIDISGIPDILSQTGTVIELENPQLYMNLKNPLAEYNVYFQTGLKLTAIRGDKSAEYEPDVNIVKTKKGEADKNEFVLAPSMPEVLYTGYTDPQFVQFSSMKKLLAEVDGIPNEIKVEAVNPVMPEQRVEKFKIGVKREEVEGSYAFYTKLILTKDSKIKYTDNMDGWCKEDLEKTTIQKLNINTNITSEVPFDVELSLRPIDKMGNLIEGVKTNSVNIPAYAKDYPIETIMEGNIQYLDGIKIDAHLINTDDKTVLDPEMKIYFNNFKAKVSGYYDTEL